MTTAHLGVALRAVVGAAPTIPELNRAVPARLRAPDYLAFSLRVFCHPVQRENGWQAAITAYYYALHDERHEIVMYHWHPEQTPNVPFPHLHLEAGAAVARAELTRAHLPTGFVPLAAVLLPTITDFGTEPLRDNWQETLDRTETSLIPPTE